MNKKMNGLNRRGRSKYSPQLNEVDNIFKNKTSKKFNEQMVTCDMYSHSKHDSCL